MSATITSTASAPTTAATTEVRPSASDHSRFGAELESAKAAIDTTGPAPRSHAKSASTTKSAGSEVATPVAVVAATASESTATESTASAVATHPAATVPTAPPSAPVSIVDVVARPVASASGPDASVATAAVTASTTANSVSTAVATAEGAPVLGAAVVGKTPVAPQPSGAKTDPSAVAAVAQTGSTVTGTSASTTARTQESAQGAPRKAPTADPAADVATSLAAPPVAPIVPAPVPAPVAAPVALPALPAVPTGAEAQPQIPVAAAAASGPMLAAAATEKPSPHSDASPVAATPGLAGVVPVPVATQPAPAAAPSTAADAPRPVDPPLAAQLVKPMAALRAAGDGNHVITIAVTPENLGPVVVRAHVNGDAIRIELVAPTEQSREALKAIMPDLRRDLSQSGGQLSLDLSSGNQPSGRESFGESADRARPRDFDAPATVTSTIRTRSARTESALDVLV